MSTNPADTPPASAGDRQPGAKGRPRAIRAATAWKAWLVVGLGMVAGYFALPTVDLQDLLYQVPGMLAAVVVVTGVYVQRPADRRPWLVLAVGMALSSTGDWTWVILDRVYGVEPFPSVADVFYLTGMGLVAVALLWLVRGRVPGGDRGGLLDALIVAVGVGLVSWVFLMAPIVADTSQSPLEIAVALVYPMLDILLLGVMVRLLLAPGEHVASLRFLIGAVVAFLLADYAYAFLALEGTYQSGQLVDAGWLLGAAFWGAAALHPSMRHVADPAPPGDARLSTWRLVLLAGASLMAPAVLVIQGVTGAPIDVPVIATGCLVLFVLVITRLSGVVSDLRTTLVQRKVLEAELERRALHDPLTGLANRVLFHDRLEHALSRRHQTVAVLFLDLDDFKTVNDTSGHSAGDEVLCSVADALRRTIRPADTVARLGGDEFAVLLDDNPNVYAAGLVAGRLIEAVQQPTVVAGHQHSIGASIGVSLGASGLSTAEELMRDADIAMYVAKGKGKGTFTVFETATHEAVVRGLELRGDMDRAIREEQFELHYQPVLRLATGEVAGVEALVRWRHPTRGLLLPAEFIPLAEVTGAIVPLGRWILEHACREAARWAAAGDAAAAWIVGVNLSALQLVQPGFADVVAEVLASSGLDRRHLLLELTETTRLDQEAASANLRQLRDAGTRLALDDFGTGYASLSQLSRIPFDIIKIDRSFVAKLSPGSRADSLIYGIVDMARRLGIKV
ncbi:MAG: EAL domain-containing protein, partial [Chloroflexota bacterium]|nr:EAL domain-containing protein [Chloroflexota bacterium]